MIENYKNILKHKEEIDHMLENAEKEGIKIDTSVKDIARMEKARLTAERDLRKAIDRLVLADCNEKDQQELERLITDAEKMKVSNKYTDLANEFKVKLTRTLDGKRIKKEFTQWTRKAAYPEKYPIRRREKGKIKYFNPDKPK